MFGHFKNYLNHIWSPEYTVEQESYLTDGEIWLDAYKTAMMMDNNSVPFEVLADECLEQFKARFDMFGYRVDEFGNRIDDNEG